ncbi:hypothetical protein L2E82_51675 [Cichorium intybus]|nr:hypothetical protein L2E82_51675 [Cichorium intybus]
MFLDCERRNFVLQGYHRDILEHWAPPPPPKFALAVSSPPSINETSKRVVKIPRDRKSATDMADTKSQSQR